MAAHWSDFGRLGRKSHRTLGQERARSRKTRRTHAPASRSLKIEHLEDRWLQAVVAPPSGLVAWWPGDGLPHDIQGPTFEDGRLPSIATFEAGLVGQALSVSSSSARVSEIADSPALTPGPTGLTIAGWIKPSAQGVVFSDHRSFGNWESLELDTRIFIVNAGNDSGTRQTLDFPDLPLNSWSHLAAVWDDGADQMRVYVNAIEVAARAAPGAPWAAPSPWVIGGRKDANPGSYIGGMTGLIDELGYFNRALAVSEIEAMYNAGSDGMIKPGVDGALDPSFDGDGKQTTSVSTGNESWRAVAVQLDGKMIVSGLAGTGPAARAHLLRFNTDGSLDTTFGGGDGISTAPDPGGPFTSVALQSDGKIVAGGFRISAGGSFGVARYNSDGTLDPSFAGDGTFNIGWAAFFNDGVDSLAIQPDGRILAAGFTDAGNPGANLAMVRLNTDGTLDTSFGGGDGVVFTAVPGSIGESGRSIALRADGKFYVVGSSGAGFFVGRYNVDGSLDTTYDGDGIVLTATPGGAKAYSAALQPDNKLVVTGSIDPPNGFQDFVTVRYNDDGTLDPTFGAGGIVTTNILGDDHARRVLLQDDGKILVAGWSTRRSFLDIGPGPDHFTVVRYHSDGTRDATFGSSGIATVNFPSVDSLGAALQSDGKIVLAGSSNNDLALARLVLVNNQPPTVTPDSLAVAADEGGIVTNSGSFSDLQGNDTVTLVATIGTVIQNNADGTWTWSASADDGPAGPFTVTITATDDAGATAETTFTYSINNVAPTLAPAAFAVVENTTNGSAVGTVVASDPGMDALTYTVSGGTGAAAFAIDAITGQLTVADSTALDFESTSVFTLQVTAMDDDGATGSTDVTISLLNQPSITGTVYVDSNQNGLYESNETGIDGVTVELLDASGMPVLDQDGITVQATTTGGGLYLFEDLEPGTYRLREIQPSGVTDGAEQLGSLGGTIVANDVMELTLARIDASDYIFAELGQQIRSGDTATIGFWQNKNGQALLIAGGEALADWLTANFGNVFGDALAGAEGADVAAFYKGQVFKQKGLHSGPAKVDAQFMALAFSVFFTSRNLAVDVAAGYGFNVTDTGIASNIVNVGSNGAAFGAQNNSERTILQLLLATSSMTDSSDNQTGSAFIYDVNGDGLIDGEEASLREMANNIYSAINEAGDI